jgi:ligand-binding sensor domain-containing protein/signal transduction histidine kinase
MSATRLTLGFVALSASFTPHTAAAQSMRELKPPPGFTVDQWTTVNGLPQNSVNAIAQTPDGYIWVGTFGGLARFDALRFTPVERVDSAGRHVDRITSLAVAPDGALWVGTEDGLLRYDGRHFRQFTAADGLPGKNISALRFDRDGTLWIGTLYGGAARYDRGHFTAIHELNGDRFDFVHSLVDDGNGYVWINTLNRFLPTAAAGRAVKQPRDSSGHSPDLFLLDDRSGSRWYRLPKGMARVRADGRVDSFRAGFGAETMIEDHPGAFWIGGLFDGLVEFLPNAPNPLRKFSAFGIHTLFHARDGTVWAGTSRDGLLRIKRNLFTTYRQSNGLANDAVTPVMETRDGSLWAGTNCGGVSVFDPQRANISAYLSAPVGAPDGDPCIASLAQDSSGTVWVGTWGGGLKRITNHVVEPVYGLGVLRDGRMMALFTSRDGTLWVGTDAEGLAEVKGRRVIRVYNTADGLASNSIRYITQIADGTIWVGTLGGVSRLGPDGRFTSYTTRDGLPNLHVRAIHEDRDHSIWIGTYGGGLSRLRGGRLVSISQADGLADNTVSAILDDGRGNFWMSGNRGIQRVAVDQLNQFADGKIRRVHSVLYGVDDGLANAETNGGFQPSAWKDRTGRLWFATIKGLASVNPADVTDSAGPPPVNVDEITVDGATHSIGQTLKVGPARPNVEFHYSAVNLSSPEKVTFRYRLDPLDHEWVEVGTRRVAYYSRLPAGHYQFLVTAANREGIWNPTPAVTEIEVLAPLYRRTWFIAGLVAFGAIALLLANEAVTRARVAAMRDERTRLTREIHDSLFQGFTGIALELDAASTRLALPPERQAVLDRVLLLIDRTLTKARVAVWEMRLTPDDAATFDIVQECEAACDRILGGTPTACHVVRDGSSRRLGVVARTECLRIVEEALTNVRKHAAASRVEIAWAFGWFRFRLSIRDDGRGFDATHARNRIGHWGMLGMQERASRIGARFAVESRPGGGTTVVVEGPNLSGLLGRRRAAGKN